MTKAVGGPAFPTIILGRDDRPIHWTGMTLRDWFAGLAMQGLVGDRGENDEAPLPPAHVLALAAYSIADAMLKERDK
jgi:hypothetical protein